MVDALTPQRQTNRLMLMKRVFCVAVASIALFACESKQDVKTPKAKTPETKKTPVVKVPKKIDTAPKKTPAKPKGSEDKQAAKDCIQDYKTHAKKRLKALTDDDPSDAIYGEFNDVDGDGKKEKTASIAYAYNAHTVLYLSNKGCLREGGHFMGTGFTAQKTATSGKKDIELWTKGGGCAGLAGSITPFKWDDGSKQYKSGKGIDCPCPMTSKVKKFHPSCPGANIKAPTKAKKVKVN